VFQALTFLDFVDLVEEEARKELDAMRDKMTRKR
jgi:hypothetical protein